MTNARSLALAALVLASACVDSELRRIGPTRPSRPPGCVVMIMPEGRLIESVDVASGTVSCAGKRERCLEALRDQACVVGADVVYGFSETREAGYTHITARFAARTP